MIEGCLLWQTGGLGPPKAVRDATEAYLAAEDAITAWIDDRCNRTTTGWTPGGQLFASWTAWATRMGEAPGTAVRFGDNLESRGFLRSRQHEGRGHDGLTLKLIYSDET
jgi:putative DNA primase/helicase